MISIALAEADTAEEENEAQEDLSARSDRWDAALQPGLRAQRPSVSDGDSLTNHDPIHLCRHSSPLVVPAVADRTYNA